MMLSRALIKNAASSSGWKELITMKCYKEYENDRRKYAIEKNRNTARSRVVGSLADERLSHLLCYMTQYAEVTKKHKYFNYDDELFAVVLKSISLVYKRNLQQSNEWVNSDKAFELFRQLSGFIALLQPRGNDTKSALILTFDWITKWAEMRRCASGSQEEEIDLMALKRKVVAAITHRSIRLNPLLFDEEERRRIAKLADEFVCKIHKVRLDSGKYDELAALVGEMNQPVDSNDYHGSTFAVEGKSTEDYICLFCEQLAFEEETSLSVKNFCRTSKLIPMEDLIRRWGWQESIQDCLNEKLSTLSDHLGLKVILQSINTEELSFKLLDCIKAAMCKGQLLVSLSEVEHNVCRVLLGLIRRRFLDIVAPDSRKIFTDVFAEYLKYYTDDELGRLYTIREWWALSAAKHNLPSDFSAPFADLFGRPPTELANMLVSVIMEACTILLSTWQHPLDVSKALSKHGRIKAFTFRNVSMEEESVLLSGGDKKTYVHKMIALHPKLVTKIEEHQFAHLLFPCSMLPMKVPPRPWLDRGVGGPSFTRPSDILRNLYDFRHMNVNNELKKRLKTSAQARPVFDALNDLGATPWRINRPMLQRLMEAFAFADQPDKFHLLPTLSIPRHPQTIDVPHFERTFGAGRRIADIPLEEWRDFSKNLYQAQKRRNELYSLWCSLLYRLLLANHYANDFLYFPHNMDFRGRVYPISPHLNHMGDDINRGLLKFARGKPLGEAGFRWLKLHCINITGHLKREPMESRLKYAEQHMESIVDSAERPFDGRGWWLTSEEPWQTLAACMEIRDALASGAPHHFISHLPIHQDGSCNGLQHYAALGRDADGGKEVNLVPGPTPMDVYSSVAERVEMKRREHEQSNDEVLRELALDLRKHVPGVLPRKVIKQTVMTTVYGVTFFGGIRQIRRQLRALGLPNEKCLKFAPYLTKQTFESLDETFTNSMKLKKWFQECANGTVRLMQPIEWITPLGLPAVQPYVEAVKRYNMLCLAPIRHKQVNAFPPNYVHSLDSTHMMLTTLSCRRRGITFAAVHDCFWTHACDVDALNRICREQFIALHKQPIIENLAEFFRRTYLSDPELVKAMPEEELRAFERTFTADFRPGSLDIDAIRDSVYFFS